MPPRISVRAVAVGPHLVGQQLALLRREGAVDVELCLADGIGDLRVLRLDPLPEGLEPGSTGPGEALMSEI
jgi:hypothetical protein